MQSMGVLGRRSVKQDLRVLSVCKQREVALLGRRDRALAGPTSRGGSWVINADVEETLWVVRGTALEGSNEVCFGRMPRPGRCGRVEIVQGIVAGNPMAW